ncbi:ABC-type transport system involved in multi-copper enzyme maturation, permease component [Sedimentisphaera salicampi]|uniref:ABC-type transport system involved in multi-copper enzyme maturation, permease component n=1 Tax=Sedimentisphaera salicampi TaxID=1941349 RepID=A0A1W6LK12_9BACT|nr:ABC-type transport system involved in multi-copper enzyme maturation, permease component [Sedimentisphaera salicampi]OXU15806.1 ABC-type transport system involved in multi-copper enzyme maturation, permease component [Sedimentisphaera salicampi]
MFIKLITIAKNTLVETLRQPVFSIILLICLIMLLISPSLTMFSIDDDNKLLREISYSTIFISGLFIAVFSASGAITQEVESKTAATVLSKPVSRITFVLGKFFGISGAVALCHFLSSAVMMMIIRHGVLQTARDEVDWTVITALSVIFLLGIIVGALANYSWDWNFASTAILTSSITAAAAFITLSFIDKQWQFNPAENNFSAFDLYSSALIFLAIIVLVSLAVLFSTRCNMVLTLLLCIGVFLLGLISDYIFGRFAADNIFAKIAYSAVPNLQVFWISDAIYLDSTVPFQYVLKCGAYSLSYAAGVIALAASFFQRREVG